MITFRGNVDTRLAKLQAGEVSATFLACAGLRRMGLADEITQAVAQPVVVGQMLGWSADGRFLKTGGVRPHDVVYRLSP